MEDKKLIKVLDLQAKLLAEQVRQLSLDNAGLRAKVAIYEEENKDRITNTVKKQIDAKVADKTVQEKKGDK